MSTTLPTFSTIITPNLRTSREFVSQAMQLPLPHWEPKGTTAEKQADNKATNSALKKAQKCKPSKQATKSSVPNNSSHETLSRNETVNQRYEEEDTTSLIGHKNNNLVSSQVSSSDNESDNGIYGDNISSPRHVDDISSPLHGDDISLVYGNDVSSPAHGNDVLSPAHRNISLLVHKNDISLPVHENNISLPNHGNDYSLPKQPIQFKKLDNEFQIAVWVAHYKRILDLATNIRTGMMTRIDKVFGTTSIPTLSHEPVSKFLEIDQHVKFQLQKECKALFLRTRNNSSVLYEELIVRTCKIAKNRSKQMIHPIKNSAEELYDELDEFVSDEVIKSILIAQDKNKDTQNAFENVMNTL
ncbi:hypothetical protein C2G38_2164308 [Gigaspora rosea]|uniref:Uncharacterized protein n=1 Tax=Gigaspora rosea TaxID=44941 RepID=A0A397VU40_9GLOM|nr:hypothetical protein C2G38_2164308 [Gigaspora rosea]